MKKHTFVHTIGAIALVCLMALASTTFAGDPAKLVEKLSASIDKDAKASAELKSFAKKKLLPLCTDKEFVDAVKAQNAKGMSLDDIKKTDQEWINAEDELPIHKELMSNKCAMHIKSIAEKLGSLTEVFVMDNQGANVGQNALTSDYWQGDEPKWANSYNGGEGGVDIDEAKLDKSTNRVDQKISLPIIDETGKVVGAICVGVSL